MTLNILAFQVLSGLCWFAPLVYLLPCFVRTLIGRGSLVDSLRVPFFIVAVAQVGFSLRWLIWPGAISLSGSTEQQLWAAAYSLNAIGALGCLRTHIIGKKMV